MKLPYATRYDGIWYDAGQEIPVKESETKVVEEKVAEPIEETPVVEEKPKKVAVKKNKK